MNCLKSIKDLFIKKHCYNCFKVEMLEQSISELYEENKKMKSDLEYLFSINQIFNFNNSGENIISIEKKEKFYFIIIVENEFKGACLAHLNFYAYILKPYKEFPKKVMNLYVNINTNKFNIVESIYIIDFIGDSNKGYGSKVMTEFLKYIKPLHAKFIYGELSYVDEIDLDNKALRNHFYEKFGFKINNNKIILKLED